MSRPVIGVIQAPPSVPLALVNYQWSHAEQEEEAMQWVQICGILVGWLGLLYLLTAGPSLHPNWPILLPQSSVNSAYIAAFGTEAILIGISVYLFFHLATKSHRLTGFIAVALIGAGLTAGALFGVRNQIVKIGRAHV